MIFDFIGKLPRFLNRYADILSVRKVLSLLCLLMFSAASLNAQLNIVYSANYKRPYDVRKMKKISDNQEHFVLKPNNRPGMKQGCIWRYSTVPAGIIVTIDLKNNTGKKSRGKIFNYKAQQ